MKRNIIIGILLILLSLQSLHCVYAMEINNLEGLSPTHNQDGLNNVNSEMIDNSKVQKRFWLINGTLAGMIAVYGMINWWKDFSDISFTDEHWFESFSTNGGADKTGHAFSTYVISRFLSSVYRKIGIRDEDAEWQGPLVGLSLMTLVEFADAFSQYGFSTSDLVADSAGALLAYLQERYPDIDDLIDFRIEYLPTRGFLRSGGLGIDTDYSGMKHLLVFKLSGIKGLRDNPLSYLEFHVGYFTRGYTAYDEDFFDSQTRNIYTAVSINLSRILESASERSDRYRRPLHITSKFLEYYQPPGFYIDCVKTLD